MTGSPFFGPADNDVNWKPLSAMEPCSVMLFFLLKFQVHISRTPSTANATLLAQARPAPQH